MALTRCRECGATVSEFAQSCPQCGFPSAVETKTGKWKSIFETGLAGVGCFLGLALIVGLLFLPLLPYVAILAAVWAFVKLVDATAKKADELPANRTAARSRTRSAPGVGNPDPDGIDGGTSNRTDVAPADTFGSRVRSTAAAAAGAARTRVRRTGRAVRRYWRRDGQ